MHNLDAARTVQPNRQTTQQRQHHFKTVLVIRWPLKTFAHLLTSLPTSHLIAHLSPHCPPLTSLPTSHLIAHLSPHCPPLTSLPTSHLIAHLSPHCPPLTSLPTSHLIAHLSPHCPPLTSLPTSHLIDHSVVWLDVQYSHCVEKKKQTNKKHKQKNIPFMRTSMQR